VNDITNMLRAIDRGEPQAAEQFWHRVYDELRRLATAQTARELPGQTLGATALVHETYLRLAGGRRPVFANRRHFFAAAAEAMRRILVENARRKGREKHGGGRRREHPDLDALDAGAPAEELLSLHEALVWLAAHDPLKAKLVELRFFGGLTLAEAAECLNISLSTADRAWRYARAWLYRAMSGDDSEKSCYRADVFPAPTSHDGAASVEGPCRDQARCLVREQGPAAAPERGTSCGRN
jgi:RNA polymerase sigma factor (TIGR02999 family)